MVLKGSVVMVKDYKLCKVKLDTFGNVLKMRNSEIVADKFVDVVLGTLREVRSDIGEGITIHDNLVSDLGIVDKDLHNIVTVLKDTYGIDININELDRMQYVRDIVLHISK